MVVKTRDKSTRSEGRRVRFCVGAVVMRINHCSKFELASLSRSRDRVFV